LWAVASLLACDCYKRPLLSGFLSLSDSLHVSVHSSSIAVASHIAYRFVMIIAALTGFHTVTSHG